jgi:hypothetical protein
MLLSRELCSGFNSESSFGVRLKNAISEPLAKPESKRRNPTPTNEHSTLSDGACSVTCDIWSVIKSNIYHLGFKHLNEKMKNEKL